MQNKKGAFLVTNSVLGAALFWSLACLPLGCVSEEAEPGPAGPSGGTGGGGGDAEQAHRAALCAEICAKDATFEAEVSNPDGGGCGYEDECQAALCSTEGLDAECQATVTPALECLAEADPSLFYCNGTYGIGFDLAAYFDCPAVSNPWLLCRASP